MKSNTNTHIPRMFFLIAIAAFSCSGAPQNQTSNLVPGLCNLSAWNGIPISPQNQWALNNVAQPVDYYGYVNQTLYITGPRATVVPAGTWTGDFSMAGSFPTGVNVVGTEHNITGSPSEAGEWSIRLTMDNIKTSTSPTMKFFGFTQIVRFHVYQDVAHRLAGSWQGNSIGEIIEIKPDLTWGFDNDFSSEYIEKGKVQALANNTFTLLNWYANGMGRTFYLQNNTIASSQKSKRLNGTYDSDSYGQRATGGSVDTPQPSDRSNLASKIVGKWQLEDNVLRNGKILTIKSDSTWQFGNFFGHIQITSANTFSLMADGAYKGLEIKETLKDDNTIVEKGQESDPYHRIP